MAYNATNPVAVGDETLKSHYDRVFDNTVANYTQINVAHEADGSHKDAVITLSDMANLAQGTFIGRTYGAGTGVPTAIVNVPIFAGGGHIQKDVGGITILTGNSPGKEAALADSATQQTSSFAVSSNGVGVLKIYPRTDVSSTLADYVPVIYPVSSETFVALVGAGASPDYWTVFMKDVTGTLVDGKEFYIAWFILTNP